MNSVKKMRPRKNEGFDGLSSDYIELSYRVEK